MPYRSQYRYCRSVLPKVSAAEGTWRPLHMRTMDLVWLRKTWPLLAATCGPLALTSAKDDTRLFALGTALSIAIARLTYTLPEQGTQFDAQAEKQAIDAAMITNTTNRVIRMIHGTTFLLAAFNFAKRWHIANQEQAEAGQNGRLVQLGWAALGMLATFWLCRVGCGFGATGIRGQ